MIIVKGEFILKPPPGLPAAEAAVFEAKQSSPTAFGYASMEELRFELKARLRIVEAARAMLKSGAKFAVYKTSKCNERYWERMPDGGFRLKAADEPAAAIRDIYEQGTLYAFECATAIVIVLYKGVLDAIGEKAFNRLFAGLLLRDWHYDSDLYLTESKKLLDAYPGDVLYFKNPDYSPKSPEWQGENVVKLEEDLYFGHGIGIKSGEGIIESLNKRRKPGSKESAYLMDLVVFPYYPSLYKAAVSGERQEPILLLRHFAPWYPAARVGRRYYIGF